MHLVFFALDRFLEVGNFSFTRRDKICRRNIMAGCHAEMLVSGFDAFCEAIQLRRIERKLAFFGSAADAFSPIIFLPVRHFQPLYQSTTASTELASGRGFCP